TPRLRVEQLVHAEDPDDLAARFADWCFSRAHPGDAGRGLLPLQDVELGGAALEDRLVILTILRSLVPPREPAVEIVRADQLLGPIHAGIAREQVVAPAELETGAELPEDADVLPGLSGRLQVIGELRGQRGLRSTRPAGCALRHRGMQPGPRGLHYHLVGRQNRSEDVGIVHSWPPLYWWARGYNRHHNTESTQHSRKSGLYRGFPSPDHTGDVPRQALARLVRHHENLSPVVALVRDEVREHVADVERQVAPDVRLRRRDLATGLEAQRQQGFDAVGAPLQRRHELPPRHSAVIDVIGCGNAVLAAERLDPAAAGVVDVSGDHAYRASWHARHRRV